MIVNWGFDFARLLSARSRRLRVRARARDRRVPLIVVPPMLGTRLRDAHGRRVWGWTRNIFGGPAVGSCADAVVDGVLEGLTLVPGIYARDVHGAMLRYLSRVGGYRQGHDMFVLDYDWRKGIAFAAARLAELVSRVAEQCGGQVDLVCPSSGGLVARYYLLYAGRDVLREERPEPGHRDAALVRRVVYIGTPQRGTLEALNLACNGLCLLSVVGRRHRARDVRRCQIVFDLLPHPDEPVAVDESHRPIATDLYRARTWHEIGIAADAPDDLEASLERAFRLHRALEPATRHEAFVIGARHRPTRARVMIRDGRPLVPECWPDSKGGEFSRDLGEPGDGSVTVASLRALPGFDPERIQYVEPRVHHDLPSDPAVHVHILEALLETAGVAPVSQLATSSVVWAMQ